MAWITPTGNLYLLKGIPLDTTYEHTILFQTPSAQQNYFLDFEKIVQAFTNLTYQRVNRDRVRVQALADDLYSCNYMVFQNSAYGDKYFYAFIKEINYINDRTSEITYELDVLQTWHFNYSLEECFIERQHSLTDGIGDNILPEPVELGEYVFNDSGTSSKKYQKIIDLSDIYYVVCVADITQQQEGISVNIYDGIFQGCTLYAFAPIELVELNQFINSFVTAGHPDSIIAIYTCPQTCIARDESGDSPYLVLDTYSGAQQSHYQPPAITSEDTIDTHTVKNNKLFTYPYNFYHVDNGNGTSLALRYEFFGSLLPRFQIHSLLTQPVTLTLRPVNYKGSGSESVNTEVLSVTNFPLCAWVNDSWQAWVANQSGLVDMTAWTGAMTSVAAFATGHPILGTLTALNTVMDALKQTYTASLKADVCKGNLNNAGVNTAIGKNTFYGGRLSVNRNYAKVIDDFFTKFGYAMNKIAIPMRNARPHWTYVKTAGCIIRANREEGLPCDDEKKICEIYDKGLTWWRYGNEIGDYSLYDNSPSNQGGE